MTVDQMLEQMPATEIIEWQAFFKIENDDRQNSRTQREMVNRLAGKKGRRARH